MKKNIKIFLIVTISIVLWSCSPFKRMYQTPLGILYVRVFSEMRTDVFVRNISCYYKTFNEFPKDEKDLDIFIDSMDIAENRKFVFSRLQGNYSTNYLEYNFELKSFTQITKSDTSNFFIDSIRVYEFIGKMIFNDSLLIQNIDSMLVETELISMQATIFVEEDSVFYNNESAQVFFNNQNKPFGKYSIENSCIK